MKRMKVEYLSVTPNPSTDPDGRKASLKLHEMGFRTGPTQASRQRFDKTLHAGLYKKAFPLQSEVFFIAFPHGMPSSDNKEHKPFILHHGGNWHGGGRKCDEGFIFPELDDEGATADRPTFRAEGNLTEYTFHLVASRQIEEMSYAEPALAD